MSRLEKNEKIPSCSHLRKGKHFSSCCNKYWTISSSFRQPKEREKTPVWSLAPAFSLLFHIVKHFPMTFFLLPRLEAHWFNAPWKRACESNIPPSLALSLKKAFLSDQKEKRRWKYVPVLYLDLVLLACLLFIHFKAPGKNKTNPKTRQKIYSRFIFI